MIAQRELLLLADDALGREFEVNLGPGRMVQRTDAYDALAEMSRRRWRSVVLTAPRGDFAGLCRASRRLQRAAVHASARAISQKADSMRCCRRLATSRQPNTPISGSDANHQGSSQDVTTRGWAKGDSPIAVPAMSR